MAEVVLTASFISINGIDVSEYITSIDVPVEVDTPEATAFGDGWRTRAADGLKDWTETSDYNQDYDTFDPLMWPLLGKAVALIVRPHEAVRSATNPEWGGAPILSSYQPINGAVGELNAGSFTLMGSGPLTRTV